jgi:hypothetical protein
MDSTIQVGDVCLVNMGSMPRYVDTYAMDTLRTLVQRGAGLVRVKSVRETIPMGVALPVSFATVEAWSFNPNNIESVFVEVPCHGLQKVETLCPFCGNTPILKRVGTNERYCDSCGRFV